MDVWKKIESSGEVPPPRLAHASCSDLSGTTLYIHGGLFGFAGDAFGDLWRYDVATASWAKLHTTGDVPAARFYHSLVAVDATTLALFGGFNVFNTQPNHTSFDDLFLLRTDTLVWERMSCPAGAARPTRRGAHGSFVSSATSSGGTATPGIFVFGGFEVISQTGHHDDLWRFDLVNRSWTDVHAGIVASGGGGRPSGRIGFALATDASGKVHIFGGGGSTSTAASGVAEAGGASIHAGASAVSTSQHGDHWVFDPRANTWAQVDFTSASNPPPRRATNGDAQEHGFFFMFGGIAIEDGGKKVTLFDDFWVFDPTTSAWMPWFPNYGLPPKPSKSFGHTLTAVGDTLFLFGGRTDTPTSPGTNQFWSYRPTPPR